MRNTTGMRSGTIHPSHRAPDQSRYLAPTTIPASLVSPRREPKPEDLNSPRALFLGNSPRAPLSQATPP
jgi:hypothetical protein